MRTTVRFISRFKDTNDYGVSINGNPEARISVSDTGDYRGVGRAATYAEIEAIREFKYSEHASFLAWKSAKGY